MPIYCVYQHIAPNGKSYIGQTMDIKAREYLHQSANSNCTLFYRAILKYGWNNFQHIILEDNLTVEQANEKEVFYISQYNTLSPNGYNLTTGGLNRKVSKETIQKIIDANTGRKHSEEAKLKMSVAMSGKPKSEEHRKKVIEANKGRVVSEETKEKISRANKGRKKTEEHKRKISESRKGQRPSKESIEKSVAMHKKLRLERQKAKADTTDQEGDK
jgi:group I intron endonuclease